MSARNVPAFWASVMIFSIASYALLISGQVRAAERVRRAGDLDDDHLHQLGIVAVRVDDEARDRVELLAARCVAAVRPRRSLPRSSDHRSVKSSFITSSFERK